MNHFVIIRFNTGIKDKEWLAHRLRYFRAFTVPSLKAQTEKNFKLIFMVDPSTPEEVKEELRILGILFEAGTRALGGMLQAYLRAHISLLIKENCIGNRVITSRLDSDDAIAKNYIEKTQELSRKLTKEFEFIVYQKGITWDYNKQKFFEKRINSPPFGSLVETIIDKPKTVLSVNHSAIIIKKVKLSHIIYDEELMWLQSFHSKNLVNKPEEEKNEIDFEKVKTLIGNIHIPSEQ